MIPPLPWHFCAPYLCKCTLKDTPRTQNPLQKNSFSLQERDFGNSLLPCVDVANTVLVPEPTLPCVQTQLTLPIRQHNFSTP